MKNIKFKEECLNMIIIEILKIMYMNIDKIYWLV